MNKTNKPKSEAVNLPSSDLETTGKGKTGGARLDGKRSDKDSSGERMPDKGLPEEQPRGLFNRPDAHVDASASGIAADDIPSDDARTSETHKKDGFSHHDERR